MINQSIKFPKTSLTHLEMEIGSCHSPAKTLQQFPIALGINADALPTRIYVTLL